MIVPRQELGENSTFGKMLSAPRHGPSVLSDLVVCCLSDQSIFKFAPSSSGAVEYYSLSEEVIARV